MPTHEPVDPQLVHQVLRRHDVPFLTYLEIWARIEKGTEARQALTEIFFEQQPGKDPGQAILRSFGDQSWRRAVADCALEHAEIRRATVEVFREMDEMLQANEPWRVEPVRIETTGPMSLGQLLLYLRQRARQYGHYEVVCSRRPESHPDVDLEPIIGVYVSEATHDVLLQMPQGDDETSAPPSPIRFDDLLTQLEIMQAGRLDFNVECSPDDPDDTEATVQFHMPVQGIGINDDVGLFVLLY